LCPVRAEFPEKLDVLFQPARYKVAHGGRGGAKSWGFARALLILAGQRKLRVLCARELQVSIADSVHKLLSEQIDALGLGHFYEVQQKAIHGANGSEFIFSGIRSNITKIKSMEGVDIVWVEEAETVSSASWNVLIPTIRKPGSEIWVSFNPSDEKDPTYVRFVKTPPPGAVVVQIGWQDNPWFPEELREEKDYLYSIDPEAADHVWGGGCKKNSHAAVLRGRYIVQAFVPQKHWNGPYQGVDWGFATDPTTLVRLWVEIPPAPASPKEKKRGNVLYVEHEAYKVGCEIDATPALFDTVPDARKYVTRADSARPETISHVRRNGYERLVAATKGPGSVEDGVEHLRSYERIVIHPRCPHAAEEARLWSYKVDRLSGDVLPELVDKHNHIWDGARYALEPLIFSSTLGMLDWMKGQVAAQAGQPGAR
jgi:phage terminase large subunit